MRRVLVALLAVSGVVGFSQASSAAPPMAWTGFYVGGNVGYSWGRSDTSLSFNGAGGAFLSGTSDNFNLNGVIGGGQAGYNWQTGVWVFGFETDFQGSAQKGSTSGACGGGTLVHVLALLNSACSQGHVGDTAAGDVAAFPVTATLTQKLDWFGTVRGRVGYTVTPTILAYGTGGLAYGHVGTTDTISGVNITGTQGTNVSTSTPVGAIFSTSSTRAGWTLGGGIECMVTGRWTAKFEYIYIDLGTVSGAFATPVTAISGGSLVSQFSSHVTDNIVRVGFSYKLAP
jgi:outer membrane immunogenic protein